MAKKDGENLVLEALDRVPDLHETAAIPEVDENKTAMVPYSNYDINTHEHNVRKHS